MPPTDLEGRLRSALSVAREPAASTDALASLRSDLGRYRARRRLTLAGAAAAALGVIGLTLGLVVGIPSGAPPQRTAAPPLGSPSAPCVEVAAGPGPAACVGRILAEAASASAAPLQRNSAFGKASGSGTTGAIALAAGQRIVVSLPHLAGVTWQGISLAGLAPSEAIQPLGSLHRDAHGRTVAVLPRALRGIYVLSATGSAPCAAPGCTASALGWSIAVHVR
jgi:hypothetical protein